MYIDLIILIALLVFVIIYSKRFQTYIFGFAMIDIFFRVLNFFKNNIPISGIKGQISKYVPESIPNMIYKYTNDTISLLLVWTYVIIMTIFLYYNNIYKKKEDRIMDKYKLAFISEDGTLEKYGEFCDDSYHAKYLLEYINKTYPNVPLFKKLTIKHNPGTIAFFISRMNKIVFMNTTMKNIKQGEFIFPDIITDKQKETLYSLAEIIKNYNITIEYNLRIEDGLINSDIIKNSPISAIDEYFQLDNTITKKK